MLGVEKEPGVGAPLGEEAKVGEGGKPGERAELRGTRRGKSRTKGYKEGKDWWEKGQYQYR